MKNRVMISLASLGILVLLTGGCGGKPLATSSPVAADLVSTAEPGDDSGRFLYDSHGECAEIQPDGKYCEMHGGHINHEGVWIQPTQLSREEGLAGVTVAVVPAKESVMDQPGNGPDLSGMKGRVIPLAITLDTHTGDISDLDLNGRVFLVDATGTEIPGIARQIYESAHHPVFVIVFPKLDSKGESLEDPAYQPVSVVVRGVGAVPERMLQVRLEPVRP